jgi:hypothetical protein
VTKPSFVALMRRVFYPVAGILLVAVAYRTYGWVGVAAVVTGLVMWLLLHFTRTMQVLQRAAQRPVGHVDSAVMLNARLQAGHSMLHVVALTRALGALQSEKDAQPEVFRWTDASGAHVTCDFFHGKLRSWALVRPEPADGP